MWTIISLAASFRTSLTRANQCCRWAWLSLMLAFSCAVFGQAPPDIKKKVDEAVFRRHLIDFKKFPAFIIALVDGDSAWYFPYGEAEGADIAWPDPYDRYELGEVTQVFTALLSEIYVQKGILNDTIPVNQLITGLAQCGYRHPVTAKELLSHRSGMPKYPDFLGTDQSPADPFAAYSLEAFKSFLCERALLDTTFYRRYRFSQIGYALMGAILQELTHTRLDQLFEQAVFDPMGMTQSCIDCRDSLAIGYTSGGTPATPWDTRVFQAALGMESSAADLVQFVQLMLSGSPHALKSAFEHTLEPLAWTGMDKKSKVARGWHVYTIRKKYDICMTVGHTGGHSAFIGLVRNTRTAVVILANSENGMSPLGVTLLEMLNYNWKRK